MSSGYDAVIGRISNSCVTLHLSCFLCIALVIFRVKYFSSGPELKYAEPSINHLKKKFQEQILK
jgi:hypothetical protein